MAPYVIALNARWDALALLTAWGIKTIKGRPVEGLVAMLSDEFCIKAEAELTHWNAAIVIGAVAEGNDMGPIGD